jgi:hypothetical protein
MNAFGTTITTAHAGHLSVAVISVVGSVVALATGGL